MNPCLNRNRIENALVAPYTYYKVGGKAKSIASVFDADGLICAIEASRNNYVVLGRGSKVLFSDCDFDGTVILMRSGEVYPVKCGIYADAGVSLPSLSRRFAANSLLGLEFACSIPASLGGAIKMNAGAFGSDIGSILIYVDVLRDGIVRRLAASDCGFSYRKSGFLVGDVILGGCIRRLKGDKLQIQRTRDEYIKRRLVSQPSGLSCGSVFKNTAQVFAGQVIDECGLKGLRVGDATVSDTHANFIVNKGKATATDIYRLIRAIKAEVYVKKGIKLSEEVIYIGSF